MKNILCSIGTRGRYHTTLPMVLMAIINQTKTPDKIVIFDDNEEKDRVDLRTIQHYLYMFQLMDLKGIEWEVKFGERKGPHYNHDKANRMGYKWVWRCDDDCIPEPNVLEELYSHCNSDVGAVGGAVLTPDMFFDTKNCTGKIEDIYSEPNIQWNTIPNNKEVDHLHCTFLYRAGVHDYNLALSKVGHREETLFSYGLRQKGFKIIACANAQSWHLKNKSGGIRSVNEQNYEKDEAIFRNVIEFADKTIVVLDNGLGDHIVFKHVLPDIKNPVVFSCYPNVVPGRSIQEAKELFGDIEQFNVYRKMDEWDWKDSLESAFRKMYIK